MANVTRIKNNQITDTTITYHKIVPGTLVGSLFNANLTLNSNVSIIGNLTVAGYSSSVSSTNTYVNDPLVVFNNGYTGTLSGYDIGILVNRNLSSLDGYSGGLNTAWIWSEAESAFIAIVTTDTGGGVTNLNNSGYANIRLGNLTAVSANVSGNLIATAFAGTFYGNIYGSNGAITNFSSSNVSITGGGLTGVNGAFTTLTATNFSTGNAQITGGDISVAGGAFTTLTATNFSTGNAQITGGDISGVDAQIDTGVITNFSSGNARISGGYADSFPIGANTAATGKFTNVTDTALTSGRVVLAGAGGLLVDDSTLTYNGGVLSASNLYTGGNANVTNGYITNLATTTGVVTNFSTGNAQITGGDISGVDAQIDTGVITNLSSGNLNVTGGSAAFTTLTATNFSTGNAQITGGSISNVNAQINTGVVTNFSTGNAKITGGDAAFTTLTATNFSTGNAQITGGDISGVDAQIDTGVVTNFSTANAKITGGDISGVDAQIDTGVITNFSSGNARISGGYADNFPIGANTAATGNFTALEASGLVHFTNTTQAVSHDTAAVVLEGGLGVQKDVWINGNLYVANVIASVNNTISVTDPLLYLEVTNIYPYTYDIGFYSHFRGGYANNYQHTGTVRNHLTGEWTFFSNIVQEPTGSTMDFTDPSTLYDAIKAGSIHLVNTTVSTGTTSGALVVDGGVGVAGALYANSINAVSLSASSINNTIIGNVTPAAGTFTYLTVNNGFATANALITGGDISGTNGAFTTLTATNFSTANALITGGDISSVDAQIDTGVVTNFSTGNAKITGGDISGVDAQIDTGVVTNFSTANALITGGNISGANGAFTTLTATNFSTANAQITGGDISSVDAQIDTGVVTNFSSGNAKITGGDAAFTTLTATNFSTGNAQITGGDISAVDAQIDTGVVTNFSTANAKITGGNITNVDAQINTGVVTNFSTANAKISGGNITNTDAQINTGVVTNFSTGNALITGGSLSGIDGAFTTLTATNFSTGNAQITGGNVNGTPIGESVSSSGKFTTLTASGLVNLNNTDEAITNNMGAVVLAGGLAVYKQIMVGGNLVATSTTDSTSTTTGSFLTRGGAAVASNVFVGKGVTVNASNNAGGDLRVRGVNTDTLIWARPNSTYDQVLIGNTATTGTLVPGAKLQINSTDTILLPVGTNAQRPSGVGQTDIAGMFRYSTTSNAIEWYNGTQWENASTTFTVIVDQQFNGDDTTLNFTLSQAATTNGIIVSINGVVQIPTLAYAVGGVGNTTLTFTEAPATGDVIDVRILTTTQTVTGLASTNGYMQIAMNSSSIDLSTGSGSSSVTTSWDASGAEVSKIAAVVIATSGVTTTIDSFSKTTYRTAKYILQASISGSYHAQEVLVVHDGSTATAVIGTAAVTGSSLGTPSVTISGSNVLLQFNAANNNTEVRIKKEYIVV